METSSSSHTILSCRLQQLNSSLMMMSPLFKEETSFTIYMRANLHYLKSVLFPKTGLFCSSKKRYCYNRDNKNAIFRIIQVTVSSCCCCCFHKKFFQNRKLRMTEFACLTAVSATESAVSATAACS